MVYTDPFTDLKAAQLTADDYAGPSLGAAPVMLILAQAMRRSRWPSLSSTPLYLLADPGSLNLPMEFTGKEVKRKFRKVGRKWVVR